MIEWPDKLTDDLAEILGRPNFTCAEIAWTYRDGGGFAIPTKAEAEQAFVIHRFVQLWAEHGPGWKSVANAELSNYAAKARAKKETASGS
jgi:hypothetical protein